MTNAQLAKWLELLADDCIADTTTLRLAAQRLRRLDVLGEVATGSLTVSIIIDQVGRPREALDTLRKSLAKLYALDAKGTEHAK